MAPRKSVGHGRAVTGPVLDMYGSYGAHFWVPWTVVLELRAAVAAILAESRSFDQLRQACTLRRQPRNVWSVGAHLSSYKPCYKGRAHSEKLVVHYKPPEACSVISTNAYCTASCN